jgi:hypothetical protein
LYGRSSYIGLPARDTEVRMMVTVAVIHIHTWLHTQT